MTVHPRDAFRDCLAAREVGRREDEREEALEDLLVRADRLDAVGRLAFEEFGEDVFEILARDLIEVLLQLAGEQADNDDDPDQAYLPADLPEQARVAVRAHERLVPVADWQPFEVRACLPVLILEIMDVDVHAHTSPGRAGT